MLITEIKTTFSPTVNGFLGAGQRTIFISLAECNLACSHCSQGCGRVTGASFNLPPDELAAQINGFTPPRHVTFTGGEPLLQSDELVATLHKLRATNKVQAVTVITNGSKHLQVLRKKAHHFPPLSIVLDYKLPSSGEEDKMLSQNFEIYGLGIHDIIRFGIATVADFSRSARLIELNERFASQCFLYPIVPKTSGTPVFDLQRLEKAALEDRRFQHVGVVCQDMQALVER